MDVRESSKNVRTVRQFELKIDEIKCKKTVEQAVKTKSYSAVNAFVSFQDFKNSVFVQAGKKPDLFDGKVVPVRG